MGLLPKGVELPVLIKRVERLEELVRATTQNENIVPPDPVEFAVDQLGFEPDPWQERVLRWDGSRLILNCSRQSGKSTIAAILGTHAALYRPGSLILLISPSLRQSSELFRKVDDSLSALNNPPKLVDFPVWGHTLKPMPRPRLH